MDRRKIVVLATAALALAALCAGALLRSHLKTELFATLPGKEPSSASQAVELIVIEDFRCPPCRRFTEKVFPTIASRFIETGRARYTLVPVAFLEGSKPLANAAVAVSRMAPDRLVPFARALFELEGSSKTEILGAAREIGGIDLRALEQVIHTHQYYDELDGNLRWAKELMGERFGTPALFVNGVRTTPSLDGVTQRMDQVEKTR